MEEKRKLHFTSQGFRSQEIIIAPELDDSTSKRVPIIENEDKELDVNIVELDAGTRARNRAFQERLDEIWSLTSNWGKRLKTEAKEAMETILNMKESYDKQIDDWGQSLQDEVNAIFDKLDNELLPAESARVDVIDQNLQIFVKETVPATIERQSGEVSRQLRRAYETFDIEKKKELKRETKLVDKASRHMQNTAQRFDDEGALLSSCFYGLEDDVFDQERRASRLQLTRNRRALEGVAECIGVSEQEQRTRQAEDVEVLDTVIETQGLLQQTVLLHFGTKADEMEFDVEPKPLVAPKMKKLNDRMSKIRRQQQQQQQQSAQIE